MSHRPLALLSVSDKTGIADFAAGLVRLGWEVTSTGGTAARIADAGVPVLDVAELTGHGAMMDGRVKTLHPAVHAGILSRRTDADDRALAEAGYRTIDLVAVNLYPFRETVARGDVPVPEAMEQVDIGGPTMIRAAAKNHERVWPVVDPADYPAILRGLEGGGDRSGELRRRLAAKVFAHVSAYDDAIAAYLGPDTSDGSGEGLDLELRTLRSLRYGENPDQTATLYSFRGARAGLAELEQLHGKELSYNNLLDLDGALLALTPFSGSERAAAVIIKHTTPCGLAVASELDAAFRGARSTDPVSAFGSVIALNRPVDVATAEAIGDLFVECLVAPDFEPQALERLSRRKNVRLLRMPSTAASFMAGYGRVPLALQLRSVYGGMLGQSPPDPPLYGPTDPGALPEGWRVVTDRAPSPTEWDDLRFAWSAIFAVKSNAILLARGGATLGIGAGQMSRVDASRLAVMKARDTGASLDGAVLASDAFFPFRDGVDAAAEAGISAVVQPGGSVRDEEVIQAANEHGMTMVSTGRRLFRH